jgi:hypothetical protein
MRAIARKQEVGAQKCAKPGTPGFGFDSMSYGGSRRRAIRLLGLRVIARNRAWTRKVDSARCTVPGSKDTPAALDLIRQRRTEQIPRMSFRKAAATAARLSGMTWGESTWRGIESGKDTALPERLAVMALAVGVTPDELGQAGRGDAADILRVLIQQRADLEPALADVDRNATSESVIQALLQSLDEIRNSDAAAGERKALERELLSSVMAEIRSQIDRLRSELANDENGTS